MTSNNNTLFIIYFIKFLFVLNTYIIFFQYLKFNNNITSFISIINKLLKQKKYLFKYHILS